VSTRLKTDLIVVHCSATPAGWDIGTNEIGRLHAASEDLMVTWWRPEPVRGRGWAGIGYHKVIRRDGRIEVGRRENQKGAHAQGFNTRSVSVCLIGGVKDDNTPEENFAEVQLRALQVQIQVWRFQYPDAEVVGHRDLPGVAKACPCFDVSRWLFYSIGLTK
jgi:hypothetical protein